MPTIPKIILQAVKQTTTPPHQSLDHPPTQPHAQFKRLKSGSSVRYHHLPGEHYRDKLIQSKCIQTQCSHTNSIDKRLMQKLILFSSNFRLEQHTHCWKKPPSLGPRLINSASLIHYHTTITLSGYLVLERQFWQAEENIFGQ